MSQTKPHAAAVRATLKIFDLNEYDGISWREREDIITAEYAPLVEAAELTVLHFKRSQASGTFQGDDEHEAWTALTDALRKVSGAGAGRHE